ncbi:MAG: hypothetical protein ACRD99_06190 [Nitrososphaera sp.]
MNAVELAILVAVVILSSIVILSFKLAKDSRRVGERLQCKPLLYCTSCRRYFHDIENHFCHVLG